MAFAAKSMRDLLDNPPPPVPSWIEPKILPKNGTIVLGGESGIGKSFLALEFQRALTTGTPLFRCSQFQVPAPCRVLYCEQEIGEVGLSERYEDSFADHRASDYGDRSHYISQEPSLLLNNDKAAEDLFRLLVDLQINVCILDPISHFHGVDENSNTQMGEVFRRINQIKKCCATQGLSFILTHHFKKAPIGKMDGYRATSADNFRGSGRNLADPDTVITLAKVKDCKLSKPHPNGDGSRIEGWRDIMSFEKIRHGKPLPEMTAEIWPKGRHVVTIKNTVSSGGKKL